MNIALKEWAVLLEALAMGRQIFLLRKGGIAEGKRGFELKHKAFLFFPTWEHQHANAVRPEYHYLFQKLAPNDPSMVDIRYFGQVEDVWTAPAVLADLRGLARHHVWTDDYIQKRCEYRPDLPLFIVLVRLHRLPRAFRIPKDPRYAGCRSWVDLSEDVPIAQSPPALTEPEFQRLRKILLADLERLRRHEATGHQ